MTVAHPNRSERGGFTLVEMLVVVVIIGVIMGLITSAVVKARAAGNAARNRADIGQLAVALENFKAKYGFYPPSQIILCEGYPQYWMNNDPTTGTPKSRLHADSLEVIARMWPRLEWNYMNPLGSWRGIDWNGDGQPTPAVTLEGDQCLVFFLGGIPNNLPPVTAASCTGFSTNPANPAHHLARVLAGQPSGDVNPPFFDFNTARLGFFRRSNPRVLVPLNWERPPRSPLHYSYSDTYGTTAQPNWSPYAYFSSYKTQNGYNPYFQLVQSPTTKFYPYSDCPTVGFAPDGIPGKAVWPYAQSFTGSLTQYLNSATFQIISAGVDHRFGRGAELFPYTGVPQPPTWTPKTAPDRDNYSALWEFANNALAGVTEDVKQVGLDDQSNFSSSILGSGGE